MVYIKDEEGEVDFRNIYVEPSIRKNWLETHHLNQLDKERPPVKIIKNMLDESNEFLREAYHSGVFFMAGTDAPVTSIFNGFSLHDELKLLVEKLGLSPFEALQSATIIPAKFMNMDADLGSIEKGKLADLVLLDENPLIDITNTRKINNIIYDGKLINRNQIDEHLELIKILIQNILMRKIF